MAGGRKYLNRGAAIHLSPDVKSEIDKRGAGPPKMADVVYDGECSALKYADAASYKSVKMRKRAEPSKIREMKEGTRRSADLGRVARGGVEELAPPLGRVGVFAKSRLRRGPDVRAHPPPIRLLSAQRNWIAMKSPRRCNLWGRA